MGTIRRATLALTFLSLSLATVNPTFAQSDQERGAAREAARDGIKAFNDGRYDEAIRLLERAESVIHAPTHLLFMARGRAQVGKLVEAREAYQKIISENLAPNAPKAFHRAQEAAGLEIAAVEARLSKLTVKVKGPDGEELQDLVVKIDGQVVPAALLGLSVPANPGQREITAVARGMFSVKEEVTLNEAGRSKVELELRRNPNAPPVPDPSSQNSEAGNVSSGEVEVGDEKPRENTSTSTIGWVSLGAGAALIGTGAVFGALSSKQLSDARGSDDLCSDDSCTPEGRDEVNAARTKALVADISMGVGIAAVGVGIYFLMTGKKKQESVGVRSVLPSADTHGGYLTLRGAF